MLIDTREQQALEFKKLEGVECLQQCLIVGDYGALLEGTPIMVVIERKSIADLFSSFSTGYEHEKRKILKAKEMGYKYILAVEGTCNRILKGYTYWNGTAEVEHPKSGLSQVRQLMTLGCKYGIETWYCSTREEMALRIQEYFLAWERLKGGKT